MCLIPPPSALLNSRNYALLPQQPRLDPLGSVPCGSVRQSTVQLEGHGCSSSGTKYTHGCVLESSPCVAQLPFHLAHRISRLRSCPVNRGGAPVCGRYVQCSSVRSVGAHNGSCLLDESALSPPSSVKFSCSGRCPQQELFYRRSSIEGKEACRGDFRGRTGWRRLLRCIL